MTTAEFLSLIRIIGAFIALSCMLVGMVQGIFLDNKQSGTYWLAYSSVLLILIVGR